MTLTQSVITTLVAAEEIVTKGTKISLVLGDILTDEEWIRQFEERINAQFGTLKVISPDETFEHLWHLIPCKENVFFEEEPKTLLSGESKVCAIQT